MGNVGSGTFGTLMLGIAGMLAACGAADLTHSHRVTNYYVESGTPPGAGDAVVRSGGPAGLDVQFLTPNGAVQGGGIIAVAVQLTTLDAHATWSLYYAARDDDSDAKAVAKDTPAATQSVPWDTSAVAAGTYHLYAQLTDSGVSGKYRSSATVNIAAGAPPGQAPAPGTPTPPAVALVNVMSPNGQEVFVAGTPQPVTFKAQPAAGQTLTYRLEYSADGGTTWALIADQQTETTYMWNVAGLSQGTAYKVRVSADDGKTVVAQATSANAFGVATAPVTFAAGFGALLKGRCAACHDTAKANVAVFEDDNYALATTGVKALATTILKDVAANKMPPAAPLAAADRDLVTLWIWSGAH